MPVLALGLALFRQVHLNAHAGSGGGGGGGGVGVSSSSATAVSLVDESADMKGLTAAVWKTFFGSVLDD
jgi:hypothetical protein